MKLDGLHSLRELLGSAQAGRPLFIVTGRLPGQLWQVTYHAGDGVENVVVARALLEADGAVVASVRRAKSADISAAFLSWQDDPHVPLLKRDLAGGGAWSAQVTLLAAFPLVQPLQDGPDVRAALDAFARRDDAEWRFRGVRVLAYQGRLLAYAADDAALRALLRPLLLQVPDAVLRTSGEVPEPPGEQPGMHIRRRVRRLM
ncbi:hypothetical protein [Deinococcus peraridilitoris]|uniref:Uncharacterized protein n=1 Tax=Deinococcus peraridilitoris (strain DSM 19664 / LMG 22246 / CIP 109416 / KR-200) TaxID=937777 RepID=K9ZZC2_DEIPD|nr:hypothetical protein [Deinococcus peraridilitoris]AFZ66946.1 hypothetical protein Deipe_1404 [Deinococcus peraridilitoris DSM 19664]